MRLTVPHFMSLGYVLERTDPSATVPKQLAVQHAEPFALGLSALPTKLPTAHIHLLQHARMQQNEGNRWLRERVIELFANADGRVR